MSNSHPYRRQPPKAFWSQAIANRNCLEIGDWYKKKWSIDGLHVATAGSCFAQHIGRYLRNSGFNFVDVEPPPRSLLKRDRWLEFGYNMYSARYGNVYSPRQLLQLIQQALGEFAPQDKAWAHNGGFVDPFRPTIEPDPFVSIDELMVMRREHLDRVARLFEITDVFVFTLGLTEAWVARSDGAVFPVCPGVKGGEFSRVNYKFFNFNFLTIKQDLEAFITRARSIKSDMKFIFTVSPVPLVATATDQQVLVATSYSKSVLRSVAGYLSEKYDYVDYFPSYEIVSSFPMRAIFFEPDLRNVVDQGVDFVMKHFFSEHAPPTIRVPRPVESADNMEIEQDDIVCDEELLQVFGVGK